jgi:hypothetical protein
MERGIFKVGEELYAASLPQVGRLLERRFSGLNVRSEDHVFAIWGKISHIAREEVKNLAPDKFEVWSGPNKKEMLVEID